MRSVVWAAVMAAFAFLCAPASAHDWYSGLRNELGESCCGGSDCGPVPKTTVRIARTGYVVKVRMGGVETEMLVPFARVRNSIDEDFHACIWGGEIKCFFAPPLGA